MRNPSRWLVAAVQVVAIMAVGLGSATPASAQFGGLRKKLKAAAPRTASAESTESAEPAGGDGGTIVLTSDVVDRLMAGLEAGEAERDRAAREDTPYGRYARAQAAWKAAVPKCEQQRQAFVQRMSADEKLSAKYSKYVDKMVEAQGRGDNRAAMAYNDSASAMTDPSCVVKQPQMPDDYYQAQRDIDARAERQTMKVSGFTQRELGVVRERTEAILRGATPAGGGPAGEKDAVMARASELKPLLGIRDEPPARATKAAPAPPPAPSQPAAPAMPPGAAAMNACMAQNVQKHEPEMRALGKRAEAAQKAGNTTVLMAIADTLQRLQMAGCAAGR